jgi:hypothetical protein
MLDSNSAPKKLTPQPKIHAETEGPSSDTRKRKEFPVDTNQPKKSLYRVKDNIYPPTFIEERMTIWPAGNIFLIESY